MLRTFAECVLRLFSVQNKLARRRLKSLKTSSALAAVQQLEPRQLLSGNTITVTTATDDSLPATTAHMTLRDAITQANLDSGGDTIVFASGLNGSLISLTQGQLNITNTMTITGPGAGQLTVSGGNSSRIVDVSSSTASVGISGLKLMGGSASKGGAILNQGTLSLSNDTISGNSATGGSAGGGGGIWNAGTLIMTNNVITGDTSKGTSGTASGGGIDNLGSLTSTGDIFSGNTATGATFDLGGAIVNTGTISTSNDTFVSNSVTGGGEGGALYNGSGGAWLSSRDTISNNKAAGAAAGGGGIYNDAGGTLKMTTDTLAGNLTSATVDAYGGGIYNAGTLTSVSSSISGNTASGGSTENVGGGIFNMIHGTLTSLNDAISGNSATGGPSNFGGGINNSGTLTSTNDTISGNAATGGSVSNTGGGIWNGSALTTTNDTISGNSAVGSGNGTGQGGAISNASVWNSLNTIVAGSTGGDYLGGGTINAQNTLIDDTSSGLTSGINGNIVAPGNQMIFSAAGLTNNGGPTKTIALAAGSPAIGTGGILGTVTADNGIALTVSNITFVSVGDALKIGTEIVQVTAITPGSGTTGTLAVLRAQDGTVQTNQASHSIMLATDQTGAIRNGNDLGAHSGQHLLTVTTTADDTLPPTATHMTLRDAIAIANGDTISSGNTTGDTITFASSLTSGGPATITLTQGQLNFTNTMTIAGPGAGLLTISANNASRLVDVSSSTAHVHVTGLQLSQGIAATGGAITNAGVLALKNVTVSGNSASGGNDNEGGAIYNSGTLTSTNDTITGNSASSGPYNYGGGIYNLGTLTSTNDVISGNSVIGGVGNTSSGGGIDNVGTLTLVGDTVSGNSATGGTFDLGGGLTNTGTLTSMNTTISGNSATAATHNNEGGGVDNDGFWTSTNDTIANNTAGGSSSATNVGGIDNGSAGWLMMTGDTVSGNSATGGFADWGGGIYNDGMIISASSTISGNSATGGSSQNVGGGIDIFLQGTLKSTNDTFSGNWTSSSGSGSSEGGGLANSGALTTTYDTISSNSATGSTVAGGDLANSGQWKSLNTIVAISTGGDYFNAGGTINAQNTLIGDTSSGLTNGVNGNIVNPTNQNILSPIGLANNGGTTKTIALAAGSPAIGAGTTLGTVTADNGDYLSVTNTTFFAVGDLLKIGTELVQVTAVANGSTLAGTLTVLRHQDGTIQINLAGQALMLAMDQTGATRTLNNLGSVAAFPTSSPQVITNPTNQTAVAGTAVTFTAASTGSPSPSVQWQISTDGGVTFTNLAGATSSTLNFTTTLAQNGNEFRAVFTNSQGTATTTAATLTVTAPVVPMITTNPTSQTVVLGQPATFTAAATGSPTPTVVWQMSTDGGLTFANIPGATSPTLNFLTKVNENGAKFRAVFTNSHGTATTTVVTLTVTSSTSLAVTVNPTNQTAVAGHTVTFTAAASGSPTPTVVWQMSTDGGLTFANIPGATSPTLNFTTKLSQNGAQFRAVFTNSQSTVKTTVATLTVT